MKEISKAEEMRIRALKDAIAFHKRVWKDINEFSQDES